MRRSPLSLLLALPLAACGDFGLVSIVSVEPIDGYRMVNDPPVTSHSVDIDQTYCLQGGVGGQCTLEPYSLHVARVTVQNNYEASADNPTEGQEQITTWVLQLSTDNPAAPALGPLSGSDRHLLPAGETVTFFVPIIDIATKTAFSQSRAPTPMRYSASYVFQTATGRKLKAATFVELAPYDACPQGSLPVFSCI
jgi:hypothetical protein